MTNTLTDSVPQHVLRYTICSRAGKIRLRSLFLAQVKISNLLQSGDIWSVVKQVHVDEVELAATINIALTHIHILFNYATINWWPNFPTPSNPVTYWPSDLLPSTHLPLMCHRVRMKPLRDHWDSGKKCLANLTFSLIGTCSMLPHNTCTRTQYSLNTQ